MVGGRILSLSESHCFIQTPSTDKTSQNKFFRRTDSETLEDCEILVKEAATNPLEETERRKRQEQSTGNNRNTSWSTIYFTDQARRHEATGRRHLGAVTESSRRRRKHFERLRLPALIWQAVSKHEKSHSQTTHSH